jgi:hypothetical protein
MQSGSVTCRLLVVIQPSTSKYSISHGVEGMMYVMVYLMPSSVHDGHGLDPEPSILTLVLAPLGRVALPVSRSSPNISLGSSTKCLPVETSSLHQYNNEHEISLQAATCVQYLHCHPSICSRDIEAFTAGGYLIIHATCLTKRMESL